LEVLEEIVTAPYLRAVEREVEGAFRRVLLILLVWLLSFPIPEGQEEETIGETRELMVIRVRV
jgi:hypothetical protein